MASETDMRRRHASAAPGASDASDDISPSTSADVTDDVNSNARIGGLATAPELPLAAPRTPTGQQTHQRRRPQPSAAVVENDPPQPPNGDSEFGPGRPLVSSSLEHDANKHRRFSILRFRNASDSQLSLRAKQQAERAPPVPRPPAIITTAPASDVPGPRRMASRLGLAAKFRRSSELHRKDDGLPKIRGLKTFREQSAEDAAPPPLATLDEPCAHSPAAWSISGSNGVGLNVSDNRQSESSRSDASSVDRLSQSSPKSTVKQSQASTPFLKLRRAMKPADQMFPMAHLPQKIATESASGSASSLVMGSTPRPSSARSVSTPRAHADRCGDGPAVQANPFAGSRRPTRGSDARSNHSSPTRANLLRGRSSTMSSMGRDSNDDHLHPPTMRTSFSTGRKSFGDLFGLSRIRQNSELSRQGSLTPATPGSVTSKSNSLQLPRGSIALPERRDDENPAKYLARLEEVVSRWMIASALSSGIDPFLSTVLRSYMRRFSFFGDPMDMALRKLLMEAELPKETQQIDRCLQAFANRYHECNPGIYSSPDQAYFIAFSLLILHTDVFNKNNKHKMQKSDYLKNTRGEGIFDEILECFYDNISYTPFIHVEDDIDLSQERTATNMSRKKSLSTANAGDPAKRAMKEPIDPYTLILDGNLDALRPNLRDAMHLDDHYNYLGTAASLNLKDLQKTFFRTGVLQIVSARSRPDAFMSERTASNPQDAHPGIVDIKITKVGLLWRKETKKRKTRSPWQEWGAILTGAQLYFFRNTSWVKNLMHQYENHIKAGHDGIPIIFKPPLEEFKPDALMSTQGAIALLDTTYKKHKNAFVYVRQGGLDEVLLADNEDERNDWLAKLNYAAAFRTSGVRMRGVVGGNYDGQGRRGIRRLDSSDATQLIQTPTGLVSIARGRIDHKMAHDIQTARRDGMQQKIAEADRRVEDGQRQLEEQLRNARHLQILAPIQPRTREQLLLAAARMAAQLEWTRMEIWKEKCHRDILVQDLADDRSASAPTDIEPKVQSDVEQMPPVSQQRPFVAHLGSKSGRPNAPEPSSPHMSLGLSHSRIPSTAEGPHEAESPSEQVFQTPPQSAGGRRRSSRDPSHSTSDTGSAKHGSISSFDPSPVLSPVSPPQVRRAASRDGGCTASSSKSRRSQEEVDADERDFLKQTGLWEARPGTRSIEKMTETTTAESADRGALADRDRLERGKVRRSLQRTLRESAGHLSHHRGRKSKEFAPGGGFEDGVQDSTLTRGAGSFVVHGKKASVINLGTELQSMSQDEKMFARKQQQEEEQAIISAVHSGGPEEDFHSAHEMPSESLDRDDRRESTTSAGTVTARSFRELHRRYSTAQAARSASAGGRLAVPSDDESEIAVSFSEGPRPPAQRSSGIEADEPRHRCEMASKTYSQEMKDDDSGSNDNSPQESEHLHSRPIQAVNA